MNEMWNFHSDDVFNLDNEDGILHENNGTLDDANRENNSSILNMIDASSDKLLSSIVESVVDTVDVSDGSDNEVFSSLPLSRKMTTDNDSVAGSSKSSSSGNSSNSNAANTNLLKRKSHAVNELNSARAPKISKTDKSNVWDHFKISEEKPEFAVCNHCLKPYKHSGNTTNLATHLNAKHSNVYNTSSSSKKEEKKKNLSNDKLGTLPKMITNIKSFQDGGSRAADLTNEVVRMLVKCKLPLYLVEKLAFKRFIKFLAPHYTLPSRKTLKQMIRTQYENLKSKFISKRIEKALSYCLTCDNWSDNKSQSYLGLTLHYVTPEFELRNANIGVFPMEGSHTAINIGSCLEQALKDFHIDKSKVLSVSTDSASNIKRAIADVFGEEKWLPCHSHILSHLVPDALSVPKLKSNETKEEIKQREKIENIIGAIQKVRNISARMRRGLNASDELKDIQRKKGVSEGKFVRFKMDMPVRWNSTLYMLERYMDLHEHVYALIGKLASANRPTQLSDDEILILEDVIPMMKVIEWAITDMSGESYATACMVIPTIHLITVELEKCAPQTEEGIIFKAKLLNAVQKRCSHLEDKVPLVLATFLDPRFKTIHFSKLSTVDTAINIINSMINDDSNQSPPEVVAEIPKIKKKGNLWASHNEMVTKANGNRSSDNLNEIQEYLKLDCYEIEANPMEIWKTLKRQFPKLFKLAVKYIHLLGSSVPSERLFSHCGATKGEDRGQLSGKYLNEILFLCTLADDDWD